MKTLPIFAITYSQEDITSNQLAEKYCDSLGKIFFTGLDNESTMKSFLLPIIVLLGVVYGCSLLWILWH